MIKLELALQQELYSWTMASHPRPRGGGVVRKEFASDWAIRTVLVEMTHPIQVGKVGISENARNNPLKKSRKQAPKVNISCT